MWLHHQGALLFTPCMSVYRIIPPNRTFSASHLYSSVMFRVTVFVYPGNECKWYLFIFDLSQYTNPSPKSELLPPWKVHQLVKSQMARSLAHRKQGCGENNLIALCIKYYYHSVYSSWRQREVKTLFSFHVLYSYSVQYCSLELCFTFLKISNQLLCFCG